MVRQDRKAPKKKKSDQPTRSDPPYKKNKNKTPRPEKTQRNAPGSKNVKTGKTGNPTANLDKAVRIAKRIARSGIASRRQAEEMILAGRVSLNGRIIDSPALNVSFQDKILVDGNPLAVTEPTSLWAFFKPAGCVTTRKDPEGRATIFDKMHKKIAPHMIPVGRLDYNTEGLLLLTNNGDLARLFELPSNGWTRKYRVRAHGKTDQSKLDTLKSGLTVDAIRYGPVDARLDRQEASNIWLTMSIKEGKNREIRKILESLGLAVNRLIRVSYGPFPLGDMKPGDITKIPRRVLLEQLGPQTVAKLGLKEEPTDQSKKITNKDTRKKRTPKFQTPHTSAKKPLHKAHKRPPSTKRKSS